MVAVTSTPRVRHGRRGLGWALAGLGLLAGGALLGTGFLKNAAGAQRATLPGVVRVGPSPLAASRVVLYRAGTSAPVRLGTA